MKRTAIVWEDVRRQLQANQNSLQQTLSESPERIKAVFRRRAVQLAQARAAKPSSKSVPILTFRLAQERYAIALKDLAEVRPFQGCTPVPGGSLQFLGVMSLRGVIRPVVDLARVLSESSSPDSGVVMVLQRAAALKVDSVEDLLEIGSEELTRPIQGHYVQALSSGALGLLDVEALLSAVLSPKESRSL